MQFSLRSKITEFMAPEVIEEIRTEGYKECHKRAARLGQHVDSIDEQLIQTTGEDNINSVINFTVTCSESPHAFVICSPFDIHKALVYANELWPNLTVFPETITTLLQLNKVYGLDSIPYSIFPGTKHENWHNWLNYHERCGRIVAVSPEDEPLAALAES